MGLDINGTQFMLFAKHQGVNFVRTATIGRQNLHVWKRDLLKNLKSFGWNIDSQRVAEMIDSEKGYAEPFLRHLGAEEINSFDNSSYEGATYTHDMNAPIPDNYKEKYSVVLDGGSLEHVFNYPVALRNVMEMVEVGGHLLLITPSNNFSGHGFYQFSPELFYSALSEENGFVIEHMLAYEDLPQTKWYSVERPSKIKSRVTLTNTQPVYLVVIARRTLSKVPFSSSPQQSDYVVKWEQAGETAASAREKWRHRLMPWAPKVLKSFVKTLLYRGFKSSFYKPFDIRKAPVALQ